MGNRQSFQLPGTDLTVPTVPLLTALVALAAPIVLWRRRQLSSPSGEPAQKREKQKTAARRCLSLAKAVDAAGGIDAWNERSPEIASQLRMLDNMCSAGNVEEVIRQVRSVRALGHDIWAYAYMQRLRSLKPSLYYKAVQTHAEELMPVVYTPTVGEACQKFGKMPMYRRGCYLSVADKGRVREVLLDYANAEMDRAADGSILCDVVLFSDGGRILGLGDLGAWGMGIPIGKLDLYTCCAGFNPRRTIPVLLDAGIGGPSSNSHKLVIRDHALYTGLKQDRVMAKSEAGTNINTVFYGKDSIVRELMEATRSLFGAGCLLQFEDFNSNDAFPLLEEYRRDYLTYNDDIQGTAAITVAGLFGALRLRNAQDVISASKRERYLFFGAGAANIGAMDLLVNEVGVSKSQIWCMNSRGLIWRTEDGKGGSFRNNEQKAYAIVGKPDYDITSIVEVIKQTRPSVLIGASGVVPGCFDEAVIQAMLDVNPTVRPVVFALSNPLSQAEVSAANAYKWSSGRVIYGSGTKFPQCELNGKVYNPGQVNNVYIFPGMSYGSVFAGAKHIPDSLFLAAAAAVAHSIDDEDAKADSVVPRISRIREVELQVSAEVAWKAKELGLATKPLGASLEEVTAAIAKSRWQPA